jgi:dihydroneopterin aldolase
MDRIFLRDLRIETIIGIYDWERETPQTVSIDLELATDVARAAASDDIADAHDYKRIAKRVIAYVGASRFQLVESLAEGIAGVLREEFGVPWVRVTVNKGGAIRGASAVGVEIERGQPG